MAVHYRTYGLILKKTDRGEADQILTVFTKDFGKLEILGKAIRKIKSKLRPGARLFSFSEIEFIQGKSYKTLTDAAAIERFRKIIGNLEKLKVAYQISRVLDSLIKGEEKEEDIWNLLSEVFQQLNSWEAENRIWGLEVIYYCFLWNLLSILGYQIDLYNCAVCQKKLLPQKLCFDLKRGGIVCFECSKKNREEMRVSPEVIKILRFFLKRDWKTLVRLKIDGSCWKSLKSISEDYLSYSSQSNN